MVQWLPGLYRSHFSFPHNVPKVPMSPCHNTLLASLIDIMSILWDNI
jgi:hypothetical protein